MKLLFDENLSPKLPELLSSQFPGSLHVRDCGLKGFPDEVIWDYACDRELTIISKDSDFYQRSVLYGHPPKLVWLRIGNCTRTEIVTLIDRSQEEIRRFIANPIESALIL